MRKQLQLGLVLEGSSSRSAILRLPHLADELGPIKSSAVRLARRFSNLVRSGYPVADYAELQDAALILVRVPDSSVDRVIDELCSSELVLNRLCFVLCDTWLGTEALERLRERGASVATVGLLPAIERNWFAVEGQVRASRLVRRVIEKHEGRVFEMKMGSKDLLFAAEMLINVIPIPLLAIAQRAFVLAVLPAITLRHCWTVWQERRRVKSARAFGCLFPICPPIVPTTLHSGLSPH